MEKYNLNTEQKIIIDKIIDDFEKINKTPIKGNLIDVASIINKGDASINRAKEITAQIEAFNDVKKLASKKDLERIKKDIEQLGLIAIACNSNYPMWKIKHPENSFNNGIRYRENITICYRNATEIQLENKHKDYLVSYTCGTTFELLVKFSDTRSIRCSSLEELVTNSDFVSRLQQMHENTKK